MHGNTKDARKWSGQAVLLVMPGWIMNSFGSFIFSYTVYNYSPNRSSEATAIAKVSVDSMPFSSLERMHFHEPTS